MAETSNILNVGFFRGEQSALDTLEAAKIIEGAFYLTTDTNRLYIGKDDNSIAPVNQGIVSIDTLDKLQNVTGNDGQFYYVEDSNILCVRSGGKWVQINEVATLDSLSTVYGQTGFQIVAQQGNTALSAVVDPKIYLHDGKTAVSFQGYTEDGKEGYVGTKAILDVYSTSEVDDKLRGFNAMEYRGTTATLTPTEDIEESVSKVKNGYSYLLTVQQSTTDDDNVIMYNPGTLIVAAGTEDKKTGYIPLDDITWTYVTGDSTDTTYTFAASASGIQLLDSQNVGKGNLTFSAGNQDIIVNLTNTSGTSQGVQISHKTYNGTKKPGTGQSTDVIPVISDINIKNGHIEDYTVSNYTLPTWSLSQPTQNNTKVNVNTSTNVATLTNTIILTSSTSTTSDTSLTQEITSDSLSLTSSTDTSGENTQLNINLVWGNF